MAGQDTGLDDVLPDGPGAPGDGDAHGVSQLRCSVSKFSQSDDFRTSRIRVVRLSEGVEWTAHCAVLLATLPDGVTLPPHAWPSSMVCPLPIWPRRCRR